MTGSKLALSAIFLPAVALMAGQAPSLSLPATVTGVQASTTSPTTFSLTTSGIASGYSLTNTTYGVWCSNPAGFVPSEIVDFTQNPPVQFDPSGVATYTVYNSYGTLPTDGQGGIAGPIYGGTKVLTQAQEWQVVNYILNYPTGKAGNISAGVNDIQAAIWQTLHPTDGIAYVTDQGTTAAALALYNDAVMNGIGFVPGNGQVEAVLLDPQTPANSPEPYQGVIVPVGINGGITITKTANTSSAKCFQAVTYTYVVTNTGSVTYASVVVVDDNGTPNYAGDDVVVGTAKNLAPGHSVTFKRSLYLPIREYAVDEYGDGNWSTLIPKVLPNGDLQFTFLQDVDDIDTTYGTKCSGGWKTQGGKSFWDDLGQNYARFCFKDAWGNTVLDFDADYVSQSNSYPSGYGSTGIHDGWRGVHSAGWGGKNTREISGITSSLSNNLNMSQKYYGDTQNSPDVNKDHNWESQSVYQVTVHPGLFGCEGFGNLEVLDVYNARCKNNNGGHYSPQPICGVITNTATVEALIEGTCTWVKATASASVTLKGSNPTTCQQKVHKCTHEGL